MEEWKEYRIKDVISILGDGIHGTPRYDDAGSVFFINGNNLENGRIVIKENTRRVTLDEAKKHRKPLTNRTLLVSINGTIGNVARYNGEQCILGKSACYFNVNDDFDIDFMYYVVANKEFRQRIERLATGTTIKNVSLETMRNYSFRAPELKEQRRIATILSSIDKKIECNKRINDNLEQQAQALFKSWFVDFEPFKDGELVESELGMIPKGWAVKQLGDITRQQNEKVKNRTDVKVLSPITTGKLVLSEEYFTKQVFSESVSKYIVVKPGDFAYNPARVNIGSLGINEFDFDGCVSPVYVVFRCEDEYQYFFDLFRRTDTFNEEVKTRAIGGVRQSLGYNDFSLIKVVYPPKNVVNKFNQIYSRFLIQTKHNDKEMVNLSKLRDELLPKLMSGELKVDDLKV